MSRHPDYPESGRRRDDSQQDYDQGESEGGGFADVLNSFSFDSGRKSRKRRKRREAEAEEPAGEEPVQPVQPGHPAHPLQPVQPPQSRDVPPANQGDPRAAPEPEPEVETQAASIRSYTWTGGRTKSNHQLEIETLVSISESFRPGAMLRMEHQSIANLCHHPRSVAEIGALMGVPIGVARVLLADMAELGLITVHQTVTESGSAPHMMLMERVLSGLRRL